MDRLTGFIQGLIQRLLPGRATEIERQSREWLVICRTCGRERSYWDIGGVRYRAKSVGKRIRVRCDGCGATGWHSIEHRPGASPQAGPH